MTSLLRYTRQIPSSTTYYNVPSGMLSAGTGVYEFVPTGTSVNYGPGYMQAASANLLANLGVLVGTSCVLRDMGKSIFVSVGSATGAKGLFRQVQLLVPSAVSSFIGGASGSSFGVGVGGAVDAYTSYFTFYIVEPSRGIISGTLSGAGPIAGGQM